MGMDFEWPASPDYAEFVRANGEALLRLAVLLTGNRHDAEDVLQDAVIAVARRWKHVRGDTALAYLRTAVSRKAIDLRGRPRAVSVDALPEDSVAELGYLRLEQDAEFVRLMQTLPGKQRAVLVLRYYVGHDDAEIGRVLGCSEATVRSQASRALAKLRAVLSAGGAGGGAVASGLVPTVRGADDGSD